jgi:hypothetical protein
MVTNLLNYSSPNTDILSRFEIATESQEGNKGSADTQNYYNTTLVLKDPDPQLGTRFVKTGQITATNPVTTDGGKTWFIEKVTIPPMLPPGQEWKPPAPPAPAVGFESFGIVPNTNMSGRTLLRRRLKHHLQQPRQVLHLR